MRADPTERALAVFVFDDDPLPSVFCSLADAEADMEAIDVKHGEYEAIYTLDGRIVTATTKRSGPSEFVVLEVTSDRDEGDLDRRLLAWLNRGKLTSDPGDRVAVANELLRRQWDSRWPKRPRWFSRRLFGDRPEQISSE